MMPESVCEAGLEPRIGRSVSLDHAAELLGVSRRTISEESILVRRPRDHQGAGRERLISAGSRGDRLYGGAGANTFLFQKPEQSPPGDWTSS